MYLTTKENEERQKKTTFKKKNICNNIERKDGKKIGICC